MAATQQERQRLYAHSLLAFFMQSQHRSDGLTVASALPCFMVPAVVRSAFVVRLGTSRASSSRQAPRPSSQERHAHQHNTTQATHSTLVGWFLHFVEVVASRCVRCSAVAQCFIARAKQPPHIIRQLGRRAVRLCEPICCCCCHHTASRNARLGKATDFLLSVVVVVDCFCHITVPG